MILALSKNLFDCCLTEHLKIADFYTRKPIYRAFTSQNLFDCCLIDEVNDFNIKEVIRFKFNRYEELKC